uniref:F-box domain-containing protein n=1 Tax=Heterorhabditis bacteriophora TaxID=37862 RepID=A0A1I7X5U6_HETBA
MPGQEWKLSCTTMTTLHFAIITRVIFNNLIQKSVKFLHPYITYIIKMLLIMILGNICCGDWFAILSPVLKACKALLEISLSALVATLNSPSHTSMNIFQAQMTSSEIRHLKLVSKDMKYLIERGGQHLTKHNVRYLCIDEINLTLDFCDRLQDDFRENRITCDMLLFNSCNIYDEDILTIVDKLLGATEANQFNILESRNRNFRFKKEFFWMPSVRKLAELGLAGECDFSDDDLLSTDYRILYLERCRISEYALRQFLEELLDSKRNIVIVKFKVQNAIDVDRLLNALSNIERTAERQWNLRNVRGRIMEIRIEN